MEETRLTSLSLVEGLFSNDEFYWNRFVVLYGPIVSLWLVRAKVRQDQADDLRQEILLAVSKNVHQYRHNKDQAGSLRRWMWGIARNKISEFRRTEAKRVVATGGTKALSRLAALPDDPFEDSDAKLGEEVHRGLVKRALQILHRDFEEKTWAAFEQTVMQRASTEEVAAALGMTAVAVRQARFRVLKRLRDELGDDLPNGNGGWS